MVNISRINNVSPSFAKRNSALKQKTDSFRKDVSDSIELSKQRKSAICLGIDFKNVQKLEDNFDDGIVTICNNYGKLPKEYHCSFVPKSIVYARTSNGSARMQEVPAKFIITKRKDPFDQTDKAIPTGYKLMNNSKGKTYIVPEYTTSEALEEKTKTFLDRLSLRK